MRVLILSQWFDPEPAVRGVRFARALEARGHSVQVLTGFPNYPGGNVYSGYKVHKWQRERLEDIEVLRTPLYPSHDRSGVRRAGNYISFALSAATIGTGLIRNPDLIYVYHPPATSAIPAIVQSRIYKAPVVYDIQDLWPDTIRATGMMDNEYALGVIAVYCKMVYRMVDRIVVLSPGFKKILIERGVPRKKVNVVYNWADEYSEDPKRGKRNEILEEMGLTNYFIVLFAGTMGTAQALESVMDAAEIVGDLTERVRFVFVGGGVVKPTLEEEAKRRRLANVVFLPRQNQNSMQDLFAGADALLVHLKDDPLFAITIPSKTQAYLAAGRPIVMAVRGDAADLVRDSGAGLLAEPENPRMISDCVLKLLDMSKEQRNAMGDKGRAYYMKNMSFEVGVGKLERIFKSVASNQWKAG